MNKKLEFLLWVLVIIIIFGIGWFVGFLNGYDAATDNLIPIYNAICN